ncbi:MAG: alanine racemase [Acidobacteria bacterium]|nr:alanine racemase [Acidobacteriota bacterium]
MNRVLIDLEALGQNLKIIGGWMREHGASWTVVTKVLCGHADTLRALQAMGVRSMGDSRLENLRAIERIVPDFESWYLRIPDLTAVADVVRLTDVSLNSEIRIIEALNEEARRLGRVHGVVIMIELGDLREGILPGSLIDFYKYVFELSHIEVKGIGANLGCLAGAVPTVDQFMQLALYRELLELKFEHPLPLISAGSSAVLPLLISGQLPKAINHFRIGEAIFLGNDLLGGGLLPGLRGDAVVLEAEIAEIKEKSLVPLAETTSITPFISEVSDDRTPGQRGYRALVSVGNLDTEISGLSPIEERYSIAGASSDITVVNIGEDADGLKVGDTIRFRPNYAAFLRLMSGRYIQREVVPAISEFQKNYALDPFTVDPVLEPSEDPGQQ